MFDDHPGDVGFNVSGLLYNRSSNGRSMVALPFNYPEFILGAIRHLCGVCNCNVLLMPHVFGDAANPESDVWACADVFGRLRKECGNLLMGFDGVFNHSEIKYLIGKCDFFIGSRMHACIAAVSQCVPAACVAYSDKFRGVMDSIGMAGSVIDPRAFTIDEIIDKVNRLYESRDHTAAVLRHTMPGVRREASDLFRTIAGINPAPGYNATTGIHR